MNLARRSRTQREGLLHRRDAKLRRDHRRGTSAELRVSAVNECATKFPRPEKTLRDSSTDQNTLHNEARSFSACSRVWGVSRAFQRHRRGSGGIDQETPHRFGAEHRFPVASERGIHSVSPAPQPFKNLSRRSGMNPAPRLAAASRRCIHSSFRQGRSVPSAGFRFISRLVSILPVRRCNPSAQATAPGNSPVAHPPPASRRR